ncbi:cobyrinate a,c-diamide synthase [Actinoallomurus rhizosphaericola]|uniref:cobyrinate a,c-diamide synthase n=1 Tax=Actinoallomurus rhizosphaericola TaxID=2952536 RepID=UPI002092D223|nr:cobyrinate a,c-diamide synthase [Actinoallomurus rhizosphaericola]MCO5999904.1 cobyrinate a,c-diamide synthase [Actinoallomurus rhizosphaericola]
MPRIVVAAPASGSGKTTVATGLMAALTARGLDVSPHKVGPDYIDPGYHALAAGRPGRNLDPWLTSEDLVAPLFLHGARDADVAVVEGVMGLFDGAEAAGGGFASTAHVARLLDAPVVLVVDASSAGRSIAALVHGFVTYDSTVRIGGVILNRVGSDRHERICRAAIEETGLPVLGVLRRNADVDTPSRHLGLIPAAERRADAVRTVERLGALVAESCDLQGLLALAHAAPPIGARPWDPAAADLPAAAAGPPAAPGEDAVRPAGPAEGAARPVVAVAGGPAFTFGYAENDELLAAAGADVVPFDPLRDEALPDGTRGIVIGGGFPEMYAAELAANEPLRRQVAAFGGPIYAECAGLLYLARTLDGAPMCGVVDAEASMTSRLTLGYREAVAVTDSPVARTGERFRGHEFHRTAVRRGPDTAAAWRWPGAGPEGFAGPLRLASYLHLHWAGSPEMASRFVGACR